MNSKRQYSLPNCNLILEGLEDTDAEKADILDGKFPLSILINAELDFFNSKQQLSGGSVFLENLSLAVSNYAQEVLSGLAQPNQDSREYPQVSLEKATTQHLHRLTLEPEPGSDEPKKEVDLTTLELFDLVDAIDQFHLDHTTLPDMTLELHSVSKRYRKPEQPLAERLTPVMLGFAGLAMAAGALFMIPLPEIPQPESTPANKTTETEPNSTESLPSNTESDSNPDGN